VFSLGKAGVGGGESSALVEDLDAFDLFLSFVRVGKKSLGSL
jgi:hypothetical protein